MTCANQTFAALCVRPRARGAIRCALVAAAAALPLTSAGCYKRVIRSEGIGSDRRTVEEPYQEDYLIDDLLFGEDTSGRPTHRKKR